MLNKDKKILLIFPPINFNIKPVYALPPLGIFSIASYLTKKNIYVRVLDASVQGLSLEDILKVIKKDNYNVVGISIMTNYIQSSIDIFRSVKKYDKNIITVAGGIHPTATGKELIQYYGNVIDHVICGDGELQLETLIADNFILDNKIENITMIEKLDTLPYIDFSLGLKIKKVRYCAPYSPTYKVTSLIFSRSCPYNCTFCNMPLNLKYRQMSVDRAVNEIEYQQQKHGYNFFVFKDSTFTCNRHWAESFCNTILARDIKIKYRINTRIDKLDDNLLKLLKKSGCEWVSFGIESGTQKYIDYIEKNISLSLVKTNIELVKQNKIYVHCNFIIGYPNETLAEIWKTYKFAKSLNSDTVYFSGLTIYPGTKIYEQVLNNHRFNKRWYLTHDVIKDSDDYLFNTSQVNLSQVGDINKYEILFIRKYYFRIKIILNFIKMFFVNPKYFYFFGLGIKKIIGKLFKLVNLCIKTAATGVLFFIL